MGRSIGVEVGGSVTGCRSSGRILLQKARNKDKNAYHSVGRMGGGGGHLDPLHDFPNGWK